MADHITIRKSDGTWSVRASGAVLGDTQNALILTEGSYDPVVYFPREDIAMALLEPTDKTTHCPHKGDASYFSITSDADTLENAAWSYETPKDGVAAIKDHLAFMVGERIQVEEL